MAEPLTTARDPAARPNRDVLLATKLRAPHPRPGLVLRQRLMERLAAGTQRELLLVCGPAGFGKSSLLADWAHRCRRPVAWLSLDEDDNDPGRFWRHVAAALDVYRPGLAQHVTAQAGAPAASSIRTPVTALINALAETADPVVLIIDDYHLIEEPAVHRSVAFLLEHLPDALRLVLAGRADPPLPLARLRARGQLTELRAADLRFTTAESAELLRTAIGPALSDSVASALAERTEGWVAGLQLAALSLRGRSDVTGLVEAFSGSHRFVLDYLTEEILDRQDQQVREFLLETSVLERVSAPLCDAVLGRTGSQQLLEEVERANLFLHPLDEARHWWRYHVLFADMLRVQLRKRDPDRVAALHGAAALWYERNDLPDQAIRHALSAGDTPMASRLIERNLEDQILRRNEAATLERWLVALPPEALDRRPRLRLGQAVAALMGGRLDEAESLLTVAEHAFEHASSEPYEPSVGRTASILHNVPAMLATGRADLARQRGNAELAYRLARHAEAQLGDEDTVLGSIVRYDVAVADWMDGRLNDAERQLNDVVATRTASGERHLVLRASYNLGGVQQAQGRLGAALRTYRHGLEMALAHPSLPSAGMAHVGLAEVLYERDELDSALEHASAGVALCRQLAYPPPLVTGLLALARIHQARGEPAAALDMINDAENVQPQVVNVRNPVAAAAARLTLAQGRVRDAVRWVEARGLAADDEPAYQHEGEYLVLARVLLVNREYRQASVLLHRWHVLAEAQQRTGSIIELLALRALARSGEGNQPQALADLAVAVALGAQETFVRVFADEGAAIGPLLGELLVGRRLEHLVGANAVPRGYLTRLAAAFERIGIPVLPTSRRGAVAAPGLVEALSAREREVLAMLAEGRPNQAIADQLVITVDTVKRHVTHVLAKLAVDNRTQAVARARQLGLLP
jgi:LuxR family maltose regulon positive regulatory protein